MGNTCELYLRSAWLAAIAGCGDKEGFRRSAAEAAKKAIQEGMQKEQKMMEGMLKGVETIEKKASEPKEETKK